MTTLSWMLRLSTIKTNTTKRIRAFNKTALAIRIIALQNKLDRFDNRQLFSTNLRVPATGPFHSRGVRILKVIATCLCYVNVLLGPGIIIYIKPAVVRKRTEMTISHNHMLERWYPPNSNSGNNDNKHFSELNHGCHGGQTSVIPCEWQ